MEFDKKLAKILQAEYGLSRSIVTVWAFRGEIPEKYAHRLLPMRQRIEAAGLGEWAEETIAQAKLGIADLFEVERYLSQTMSPPRTSRQLKLRLWQKIYHLKSKRGDK